jgi:hypothetical protein
MLLNILTATFIFLVSIMLHISVLLNLSIILCFGHEFLSCYWLERRNGTGSIIDTSDEEFFIFDGNTLSSMDASGHNVHVYLNQ